MLNSIMEGGNLQMEVKIKTSKRSFVKSPIWCGIRKKILICLLIGVLSAFLSAAPVYAIPSYHDICLPFITQDYPKWCWAACGASTVNYYGGNINQANFSFNTTNSVIVRYASVAEVGNGLSYYALHNHPYVGTMGYSAIQTNIYSQARPVLVALFPSSGSIGHMVAITGYEKNAGEPDQVILMDPAYSNYRYITHAALYSSDGYSWQATIDQIY